MYIRTFHSINYHTFGKVGECMKIYTINIYENVYHGCMKMNTMYTYIWTDVIYMFTCIWIGADVAYMYMNSCRRQCAYIHINSYRRHLYIHEYIYIYKCHLCIYIHKWQSSIYISHLYIHEMSSIYTCTYLYVSVVYIYIRMQVIYIYKSSTYTWDVIYTYICIYICVYTYVHMYTYMYIYEWQSSICVLIYIYMRCHLYMYINNRRFHLCIHKYILTYMSSIYTHERQSSIYLSHLYIHEMSCIHIYEYVVYMCHRYTHTNDSHLYKYSSTYPWDVIYTYIHIHTYE